MSQDKVKEYKCPNCGGALTFDAAEQKMVCAHCYGKFSMDELNLVAKTEGKDTSEENNWSDYHTGKEVEGMKMYVCPSCGGEIVGDETVAATQCPYCGNPTIVSKQLSGMYAPDGIIPFTKKKEDAIAALKEFYRGKFLLPKIFKSANKIEKIQGVYVPFWLFDCQADGSIRYDATRTHSWSSGDTDYVRTDHYLIIREGKVDFSKIPVDGSKKMDDEFMDSIEPFDYNKLSEFKDAYLSGYLANKYDVNAEDCLPRVNERVRTSLSEAFASTVIGYVSLVPRSSNINIEKGQIRYVLMPVWILNTKMGDKTYTFMMNGQTGEMVGSLPMAKGKAIGLWLGIFAVIMIITILIVYAMMGRLL